MLWAQHVNILGDDSRFLVGPPIELPIPPFPGLHVGALTVEQVFVCQGWDGKEQQSISYLTVSPEHAKILESHGWRIEEEV